MKLRFKKLSEYAVAPKIATVGDAGADLTAVSAETDLLSGIITYYTGIAVEIPKGYVGLLFPRSSVYKKDLSLANHVGVIDSGYRGEIMFKYRINDFRLMDGEQMEKLGMDPEASKREVYKFGERIGQLVVVPIVEAEWIESEDLTETDRGTGGYGSTGQ